MGFGSKNLPAAGMTLIEMVIGLSIAGIFTVIVASSFGSLREFAARATVRGEAERMASEIVQFARARINTRNADGLNLQSQSGDDYRMIEVDRTANGKTEEMIISMTCEAGPKGIVVPTTCGMSCGPGMRPVTRISSEKSGSSKMTRVYPPTAGNGGPSGSDAVGVTVCMRRTADALQLRTNVFYGRGTQVKAVVRQANMPAAFFVQAEAALVP